MFINISNHPSSKWSKEQLEAAGGKVNILDIPFPNVNPRSGLNAIEFLSQELASKIEEVLLNTPRHQTMVHVMGEMGLTYNLVRRLTRSGYAVVHSTTERLKVEKEDGTFGTEFRFVQFRNY